MFDMKMQIHSLTVSIYISNEEIFSIERRIKKNSFCSLQDCVYGAAYQISNEDEQSVRKALDEREKDGYTIVETIFYPNDQKQYQQMPCYTYMAQAGNTFWGGEAPIEDIARQIARAEGPSGTNREYLFKLVDAIKAITPINDEHLTQLQQLVKKIINEQENQ